MIKEMGINNIEFSNLFGKTATEMRALLDERGMICTPCGRILYEEGLYIEDESPDVVERVPQSLEYITGIKMGD